MSEDSRVKRWRDTKRQHGLKAVTIWLTTEEELRIKDLALQWHCSPSAVMQQALAQVHRDHGTTDNISSPTDTSLIRQLIREELAIIQATQASVTVGYTVTPTDTLAQFRPDDGQTDVIEIVTVEPTDTEAQFQPDDGQTDVAETVTETVPVTEPSSQARAYGEVPAGVLAVLAQRQAATAAELAKALGDDTKAGTKAVWQALQRLLKRGAVIREGLQYRLPA